MNGQVINMSETTLFVYRFTVTASGRKQASVFIEAENRWRVCGYSMAEQMVAEGKGVRA
jgi:hypothetical protein